ncbi:MAG: DUF3124 domain-containing protein [Sideroxydans sp.]|nr:DUF3124 domain-containing protein [Sideroxydans sp.]
MKNKWLALILFGLLCNKPAQAEVELSLGQTLYLPIYSHIWHGDKIVDNKYPNKAQVSALVSIRNTSLKTPIRILSARYYSTDGKLLKEYQPQAAQVGAMGTLELFVERKESAGGSGANFIIQWEAATPTNPPVVEAIHADVRGGAPALSFVTTARAINPEK